LGSDDIEDTAKLEIKIVSSVDGALACLYGRVDIDSSPALRDRLLALLQASHPEAVTVDLSAVTHIDSSGIATLIEALKIARSRNAILRLRGLHGRLLHLFQVIDLISLFDGGGSTVQCGPKAV
jgi:anti-anti-sigma factor